MNKELRKFVNYYKDEAQKKNIIKYAIIGFIVSVLANGLAYQSLLKTTGRLTAISYNPFNIIKYGLISCNGLYHIIQIILMLGITGAIMFFHYKIDKNQDLSNGKREFSKDDTSYGSNKIADRAEQDEVILTQDVDKAVDNILGHRGTVYKDDFKATEREANKNVLTIKDGYNNRKVGPHWMIVGPPGRGKTSNFYIINIKQMIDRGESVILTDPKGELREATYLYAKEAGHKVREFNLIDTFCSDSVNFLDYIRKYNDAEMVVDVIINELGSGHPDYWEKGERQLILFTILYLIEQKPKGDKMRGLAGVHNFLQDNSVSEVEAIVEELPSSSLAKKEWRTFKGKKPDIMDSFLSGLATKLGRFNDPVLDRITTGDDINLLDAIKEPCVYYVMMPDTHSSNDFLATIFFSLLFKETINYADLHKKRRVPMNFILEEFCNIGRIPNITKFLGTIRSRGMRCFIALQGLPQLQDTYTEYTIDSFMEMIDNHLLFGANDKVTADYYQWKAATGTMDTDSKRYTENIFIPRLHTDYMINSGTSQGDVLTSGDIERTMDFDNFFLFLPSYNVMEFHKYYWKWHPDADKLKFQPYIEHTPNWWKEVEQDKNLTPEDKKWFVQGLQEVSKHRQIIKEESEMPEKDTRKTAEKKKEESVREVTVGSVLSKLKSKVNTKSIIKEEEEQEEEYKSRYFDADDNIISSDQDIPNYAGDETDASDNSDEVDTDIDLADIINEADETDEAPETSETPEAPKPTESKPKNTGFNEETESSFDLGEEDTGYDDTASAMLQSMMKQQEEKAQKRKKKYKTSKHM